MPIIIQNVLVNCHNRTESTNWTTEISGFLLYVLMEVYYVFPVNLVWLLNVLWQKFIRQDAGLYFDLSC